MSKLLNVSEFINIINSRLILKPNPNNSLSKHGLETPLKSLFYLFVRVYAVLCTVHGQ